MSELPDGIDAAEVPAPRPSALGIVLRTGASGRREVLLGLRARGSHFMPGHLAFPGGRLDPEDGGEDDAGFRRCATREMKEEIGLEIPEASWLDAGERTTPPFFPVRYRTKFWVAELPGDRAIPEAPLVPEELEAIVVSPPGEIVARWDRREALVPPPLLPILRLLDDAGSAPIEEISRRLVALNAAEDATPRIEFVPGYWVYPVRTATMPPATHTNVWMPGGERFAVIDPGSDVPEEIESLLRVVEKRAAEGAKPAAVLLTHHHRDHVRGAGETARRLGVPVRAHPETLRRAAASLEGVAAEPIGDGETLDLGGVVLRAIHTPGHAPGHLAFHDDARGVLLAGDLVSGLSTILVGLDGGDMGLYLDSLRRMAALSPRHVLPSHGPPLPGKAFAKSLEHRAERERLVLAALDPERRKPLAEIAAAAYADTPEALPVLRDAQTRAILEHLERSGRAARADEAGGFWREA